MPTLTLLLLAAGASSRMRAPKIHLPLGDTTLLGHALRTAAALGHPIIIVSGKYAIELADLPTVDVPVRVVHNPQWAEGMSGSIVTGVRAAGAETNYLVLLADQPTVTPDFLSGLLAVAERHPTSPIATNYYPGTGDRAPASNSKETPVKLGVPAYFPAAYHETLLALTGPHGARHLLREPSTAALHYTPEAPPVDIDTPAEYQRFLTDHAGD